MYIYTPHHTSRSLMLLFSAQVRIVQVRYSSMYRVYPVSNPQGKGITALPRLLWKMNKGQSIASSGTVPHRPHRLSSKYDLPRL